MHCLCVERRNKGIGHEKIFFLNDSEGMTDGPQERKLSRLAVFALIALKSTYLRSNGIYVELLFGRNLAVKANVNVSSIVYVGPCYETFLASVGIRENCTLWTDWFCTCYATYVLI
jgi:hypothetical protein